jgi:hypothetical protein
LRYKKIKDLISIEKMNFKRIERRAFMRLLNLCPNSTQPNFSGHNEDASGYYSEGFSE